MILVKPSFEILNFPKDVKLLETAGRLCYKTEPTEGVSSEEFVGKRVRSGHESVIEHLSATVKFICDRGVSHEIVRHRLASYSQESTRYCNSAGGVTFVIPPWVDVEPGEYDEPALNVFSGDDLSLYWLNGMISCESFYVDLLRGGWSPQQARSVLPNSLKTELIMTANMREWRHFFRMRCSAAAHPQMRELAVPLLDEFQSLCPVLFNDVFR